jgi:protein-disulfide isomerase
MSKMTKPLLVIVVAIVLAGGAGLYLAKKSTPEASTATVTPTGGGRFKGPENAPITLMEFGDYQCPSCGAYFPVVNEIMKRYPTQVRLEFHHYPLINIHPHAMAASMAAEAAGDQGRFWEMHDLIFENQDKWSRLQTVETEFLTYAGQLGLNINQFMQSMRSPDVQRRVLLDVTRAREAKLDSVPSFFVNGQKIDTPRGIDEFSSIIQGHLPK